jgi:hypothetical protein
MLLTQICRKLSLNPYVTSSPVCYELVYIHGALSVRTVLIERFVRLFLSVFVSLCLFLCAFDHLCVYLLVRVLDSFLLLAWGVGNF